MGVPPEMGGIFLICFYCERKSSSNSYGVILAMAERLLVAHLV